MRKSILLIIGLVLCLSLTACNNNKNSGAETATTKTFEAKAPGFSKELSVTLVLANDEITEVKLDLANETPSIGQEKGPELVKMMIDNKNVDVDAISGATITSNAIKEAMKKALEKAGIEAKDVKFSKDVVVTN